jgi:hypothetical protein
LPYKSQSPAQVLSDAVQKLKSLRQAQTKSALANA